MSGSKETIKSLLIVVEEPEIRKYIREFIVSFFPSWRVLEVACGEEGINVIPRERPDLVLMDILLPSMIGIETTRHIKTLRAETVVALLTLYEFEDYRMDAFRAGASAFIPMYSIGDELYNILQSLSGKL
jgi:two-component system, response regulator YesN